MKTEFVLGIDCGGTHTDAALLAIDPEKKQASLAAYAKTTTNHENLPFSIKEVLSEISHEKKIKDIFSKLSRVTLGTTLEVNALVQGKGDKVGLAVSAGPGLSPMHFVLGENICLVPGGLDHRGIEIEKLKLEILEKEAKTWPDQNVRAAASVGKFSPRNPEQEIAMGKVIRETTNLPVSYGHALSGRLDFPRRIATAYYNAAVYRLHQSFLNSVENAFKEKGINAQCRLLRGDGGAIPFQISRKEPVQSILSGPAASVMGALAMWEGARHDCALLLDVGGTTTDIAVFLEGSPVVDRLGMRVHERRTLIRSLASISIGVGGDSIIRITNKNPANFKVETGPLREGPAAAFGGSKATLLDALNYLDAQTNPSDRGDLNASIKAIETLKNQYPQLESDQLATLAVEDALRHIAEAVNSLIKNINTHPIYTLAALKSARNLNPTRGCIAGGPASCLQKRLEKALNMNLEIAPHPQIANAIGAALTLPTASLEVYADTGKRELWAPTLDFRENISSRFTLEEAEETAKKLLERKLMEEGIKQDNIEIASADMFATLDERGYGAKDIRVTSQARPGIAARLY